MEEIDKIIITTLNNLSKENGAVIPEDITSLKHFDSDMVVTAISTCLEFIIPSSKFPKKLPPSMALRLKTASFLAQEIKNLGYTNEIGYQSILYFNELELRKLLVYLIEHLPKQSKSPTNEIKDIGYVPKLMSECEKKVSLALNQMWIPLQYREDCCISLPSSKTSLFPSILCDKFNFTSRFKDLKIGPPVSKAAYSIETKKSQIQNARTEIEELSLLNKGSTESSVEPEEVTVENLNAELNKLNCAVLALSEKIKNKKSTITQLMETKEKSEESFNSILEMLKVKTKTARLLEQEENLTKIQTLINEISDRLIELAKRWDEVKSKLLEEYKKHKESNSESQEIMLLEKRKYEESVLEYKHLCRKYKDKEELEAMLGEKIKQIPKNNKRSFYTNNIFEIIRNIKKQNVEIQKILKDTKEVQRDINNLSGQIDRSFKESDELIFYNAKEDETARTLYKLLALLRDECSDIMNIISNIGSVERETRSLQEQLDVESAKEIDAKLKRINEDLQNIRKETEKMLEK